MVRAIDLNELAEAVTTVARLIDVGFATGVWNPESVSNHPTAQRFNGNLEAMAFWLMVTNIIVILLAA